MPLICAALDMGHSNIKHMQEELGKYDFLVASDIISIMISNTYLGLVQWNDLVGILKTHFQKNRYTAATFNIQTTIPSQGDIYIGAQLQEQII